MFSQLSRLAPVVAAAPAGARGMATLKEISTRLKSVKNIQKITKSMKVVSTAKFARAKSQLEELRAIGKASQVLVDKAGIKPETVQGKQLVIALSSDRGLCGGIHSGLVKTVRRMVEEKGASADLKIVPVGDKPRAGLQRTLASSILVSAMDIGRRPPVFQDAAFLAQNIIDSGYQFNSGVLLYNHFHSAVSYKIGTRTLLSPNALEGREELNAYDEVDSEVLQSYLEFDLATNIYYAMLEGTASELSARMSAMENASNNAGDMIQSLTLAFNRTRQAVITRELIEIISGASALE